MKARTMRINRPKEQEPPVSPCLWVRDLDDIITPSGQQALAKVRATCKCPECKMLRRKK